MPVAHRSLRITAADATRIERLRDRCGPRVSASEAVRTAIAHYIGSQPLKDVTVAADQLADELETGASKVWGISLLKGEAEELERAAAAPPPGVRRSLSRNEIVRLAILLAMQATDDVVHAAHARLPKIARGATTARSSPKKVARGPRRSSTGPSTPRA